MSSAENRSTMKSTQYLLYSLFVLLVVSCTKMDKGYSEFIKNGPIVYTGKPDTVITSGGRNRVQLQWVLKNDLTITTCKVFWNLNADSLELPVTKLSRPDTLTVIVNNLEEGSHSFVVHTYDKDGNKSVGAETIGYAYSNIFASTITNRPVRTVTKEAAKAKISIAWVGIEPKCLGTEWKYTGTDQTSRQFYSPVGDSTYLNGCDVLKPVVYRSLFAPEKNAIDTFYTDYKAL